MATPARAAVSTNISAPASRRIVMPVYYECIARRLPVYTIANIDDIYGRIVAYERLLLPFSDGGDVTHVIASLKTISEDGGFEIKNLMRGNDNAAGAETSHRHRPRPVPSRARPHPGRRRARIRLARWNLTAPIPRWSDRSSSACC